MAHFFAFLTQWVYHAVCAGPVGRFFCAYPTAEGLLHGSLVWRFAHRNEGKHRSHTLYRRIAVAMDQSPLKRGLRALGGMLCRSSLRTVGLFLLVTGAYAMLLEWLIAVMWQSAVPDALLLFSGGVLLLLGILLLFSDLSLGAALSGGAVFALLFSSLLGLSGDSLRASPREGQEGYVFAVPLGMLTGALFVLIGPFRFLLGVAVLLFLLISFASPESGITVLLASIPFVGLSGNGSVLLTLGAAVVLFSYVIKLLEGRRAFHLEIMDVVVFAMIITALTSAVAVGTSRGVLTAVMTAVLMSVYVVAINVLSTPQWLIRSRSVLVASASAASLLGIWQFVSAAVETVRATGALPVFDVAPAVRAGFANQAVFAYFMVLAFPFALHTFLTAPTRARLASGLATVLILSAGVVTFVQSAWVALLLELVVFFLMYERRVFPFVLGLGILTPATLLFLPREVRGTMRAWLVARADISGQYMAGAWRLIGRAFFGSGEGFFGIGQGLLRFLFGLGTGGAEAVCSLFGYMEGSRLAAVCGFWPYRLLEGGLLGVILPVFLFLLLLQNAFSAMRAGGGSSMMAAVSSALGILILFVFRYFWYDMAALFAFFALLGIIGADARFSRTYKKTGAGSFEMGATCAKMDF